MVRRFLPQPYNATDIIWRVFEEIAKPEVQFCLAVALESQQPTFERFDSLKLAEGRIRELVLDSQTVDFWVGARPGHQASLWEEVLALHRQRAFDVYTNATEAARVHHLAIWRGSS